MLTLKDVRANMIHAYGPIGEQQRESCAEVVLILAGVDYVPKRDRGGKTFSLEKKPRIEQFRFIASPEELRNAAKALSSMADCVAFEFEQMTTGQIVSAKKADPQSSFLDESEPKSDSATNPGVSNGQS